MRITLINADQDSWASGMRSISAVLRQAGHDTRKVLAGGGSPTLTDAEAAAISALAEDSRIVGVSSMSRASARAKAILAALRRPGRFTVWGGVHPTLFPADCIPHADMVCRGEGEGFMVDLAERLSAGTHVGDIPNGAYDRGAGPVINALRPPLEELDSLPFPDYDADNEFALNGGTPISPDRAERADSAMFSGSRGCLYRCSYCSDPALRALYRGQGTYARKMSVRRFVEVAEEHRRAFPRAKTFYFTDEDFFARSEEELREFAELYPSRVGIPFECMASPLQVTEAKTALMVQAGMWRIDVGLESGSERTRREVMSRPVTDAAMVRAARAINSHPSVVPYYFLIIGNPYETREDLVRGMVFLRQLPKPFFLRTYNLVFLPGTQLFERASADGIISGIEESGHAMDFLAGYDYRGPAWKSRNLFLNSLLSLMAGRHTARRMGVVPAAMLPALTRRQIIDICDRQAWIGKLLVRAGRWTITGRRRALVLLSGVIGDPKLLYGLRFSINRRLRRPKATRS